MDFCIWSLSNLKGGINIFVDYNYYVDIYHGNILTQSNFNKYAKKACNFISSNTIDRINDSTINSYPSELVGDIKDCACDLAEKFYDKESIYLNAVGLATKKENNITSERSGEVAITYGSSDNFTYKMSDPKYFNDFLSETLKAYLYPRKINGIFYNLTSKVLTNCKFCNII